MYCLWPLPCLLLVYTTLVCVYCLWPLPCLLLVCTPTTLVCVLFVATPTYTIIVYYSTPRMSVIPHGSSSAGLHVYYFSILLVCLIIVGVVVLASTQTFTGFVIVLWVFQYYIPRSCPVSQGCHGDSMDLTGGEESPWMTASHWRQKQTNNNFFQLL